MVRERVTVKNKSGLHLRPAGIFVKAATSCTSSVKLLYKEKVIEAKNVLNVMGAGIKCGEEIEIQCEGESEVQDLATMIEMVKSGLGEEL